MGILRKSAYLGMALTLLSAPLLACSLPGLTMSEEEQECCRHKAKMCGEMQMDESQTCCTKSPTVNDASLQLTAKFSVTLPDMVGIVAPAPALPQMALRSVLADFSAERCSKSPPGQISVLRI